MAFAGGLLGKMTIIFYPDVDKPGIGIPFTPSYNPASLQIKHTVKHDTQTVTTIGNISKKFIRVNPRSISMELFFDGTGASPSNLPGVGGLVTNVQEKIPVDVQVETFLKLGYQIESEKHQPNYMMLVWGTFIFTGVLKSANVTYTMFDSGGRPIRAKISISVLENVDLKLKLNELKLKSSDVSKSITVVAGDTLPLLCDKAYGDSTLYPKIAEINGLTNYRKLKPGMQLLFPPIMEETI